MRMVVAFVAGGVRASYGFTLLRLMMFVLSIVVTVGMCVPIHIIIIIIIIVVVVVILSGYTYDDRCTSGEEVTVIGRAQATPPVQVW